MISSRDPDIQGTVGRAWNISDACIDPERNSLLSVHVVEYEWLDGNTSFYNIGLIHLRGLSGSAIKIEKLYPNAAYELAVFPLNPSIEVNIDKADHQDFSGIIVLPDVEFGDSATRVRQQFNGLDINDTKAVEIALECIEKLLTPPKARKEQLNPDRDYNENWAKTVQAAVDKRTRLTTYQGQ